MLGVSDWVPRLVSMAVVELALAGEGLGRKRRLAAAELGVTGESLGGNSNWERRHVVAEVVELALAGVAGVGGDGSVGLRDDAVGSVALAGGDCDTGEPDGDQAGTGMTDDDRNTPRAWSGHGPVPPPLSSRRGYPPKTCAWQV